MLTASLGRQAQGHLLGDGGAGVCRRGKHPGMPSNSCWLPGGQPPGIRRGRAHPWDWRPNTKKKGSARERVLSANALMAPEHLTGMTEMCWAY